MADQPHHRRMEKCSCGRELRSKQEQLLGECRRCQENNSDFELDSSMEDRSDDRRYDE